MAKSFNLMMRIHMTKFTKRGALIGGGIGLAGVIIAMIFFVPLAIGMVTPPNADVTIGAILLGLFAAVTTAIIPGGLVVLGGAAIGALIGYMIQTMKKGQSLRIVYAVLLIIAVPIVLALAYMYKFETGIFSPKDCAGWRDTRVREVCFRESEIELDEKLYKDRQCAQIKNERTRDTCFRSLALESKNSDLCSSMSIQERPYCFLDLVKITGDKAICDKIDYRTSKVERQACERTAEQALKNVKPK